MFCLSGDFIETSSKMQNFGFLNSILMTPYSGEKYSTVLAVILLCGALHFLTTIILKQENVPAGVVTCSVPGITCSSESTS